MSAKSMTAISGQENDLRKNDFTGLHAPGLLAKWPVIGIIMFIFGSLVFGALTYNLFAKGLFSHGIGRSPILCQLSD